MSEITWTAFKNKIEKELERLKLDINTAVVAELSIGTLCRSVEDIEVEMYYEGAFRAYGGLFPEE